MTTVIVDRRLLTGASREPRAHCAASFPGGRELVDRRETTTDEDALDRDDAAVAAAGDIDAFERIYRRHLDRVHRLARLVLSTDDVDDALQEVFVRVWRGIGSYRGDAELGMWIHRVATNALLRHRETARRGRREPSDCSELPARTRERPDLRVDLEAAIRTLPDGAREIFVLHDVEGLPHAEIADRLGISSPTSRSQLHRARAMLREHLMKGMTR